MASLSAKDKMVLEELFGMGTGFVLDFSNNQFERIVYDLIHINIYQDPGYQHYSSKANKLRQIWEEESDWSVGVLLEELLYHCEDWYLKKNDLNEYRKKKINEMLIVATKLKNNYHEVVLPDIKEETFQTLKDAINIALANNTPELAIDRIHTFATKELRMICQKNNILTDDGKGNSFPLHSLAGQISKRFSSDGIFQSEFTRTSLKNCISLFEKFNDLRNKESYAHDNKILQKSEAEFAVRIMAAVLSLFHSIDKARDNITNNENDDNLPFNF